MTGYRRPLNDEDVWDYDSYTSKEVVESFEREWTKEVHRVHRFVLNSKVLLDFGEIY